MTATTTPVALDVRPLSGTIGAEVRGVDVKQVLAPDTVAAIRRALLDHKVIFLPDQHLDAASTWRSHASSATSRPPTP